MTNPEYHHTAKCYDQAHLQQQIQNTSYTSVNRGSKSTFSTHNSWIYGNRLQKIYRDHQMY